MEKKLASIYLDPSHPASFSGLDAVYRAVKEEGETEISRKQVQDCLSQQDVYTLHKPARRRYKRGRVKQTFAMFKTSVATTRVTNTCLPVWIFSASMHGLWL